MFGSLYYGTSMGEKRCISSADALVLRRSNCISPLNMLGSLRRRRGRRGRSRILRGAHQRQCQGKKNTRLTIYAFSFGCGGCIGTSGRDNVLRRLSVCNNGALEVARWEPGNGMGESLRLELERASRGLARGGNCSDSTGDIV